jgi:hypothetical protein
LAASAPSLEGQREKYVGDAACLPCHREQSEPYQHTAHHLTSQPASASSILGSFLAEANVLMIADPAKAQEDPGLYFKMEARENNFYQTSVAGWPGHLQQHRERIDVVIGSGVRGQSYLYWRGELLFELPVSYWSDGKRWINSPGYKNGAINFDRAVTPRCLECHATYIAPRSRDPLTNRYDPHSLVMGISCERCHGPGADHVAQPKSPMLNPATFSRDRQIDVCALCHNGIRHEQLAAAFSFMPGDTLDNFLQHSSGELASRPDVHGNQVGLLQSSRCYLSSPQMSCSTCHDVHRAEQPVAVYSERCLRCHKVESCGMAKTVGAKIAENCIDCHMPVQSTNAIISETAGEQIRPKMRNHWIRVYR